MPLTRRSFALPLRLTTPAPWAESVLEQPLPLLNDHAHLERKAATSALEMLLRWPDPCPPENWVRAMTTLAADEVDHLQQVCRLLARRGGRLTRSHRSPYAQALRQLVRVGAGPDELVDRLITAALIEARSCERFGLLADACERPGGDAELGAMYRDFHGADYGHYKVYLDLARRVQRRDAVDARWEEMLDAEAHLLARQPPGPRIHGWEGTDAGSPRLAAP